MKTIFEYHNYREYLKDFFESRKSAGESYSYRKFSSEMGFKSPSAMLALMNGKSNLSERAANSLAERLGLNKNETSYFELLVKFNQEDRSEKRAEIALLMFRLKGHRKLFPLAESKLKYLARWEYTVLKELISLPSFEENHHWVSQALGITMTSAQLKEAVETLMDLSLVTRDPGGKLRTTQEGILTTDGIMPEILRRHHEEFIDLAKLAIQKYSRENREYFASTFPISSSKILAAKELVRQFHTDLLNLLEENQAPDSVFQMNVQFFPVALPKPNSK